MLKSYTVIWTIITMVLLLFLLAVCGKEITEPTSTPGPNV